MGETPWYLAMKPAATYAGVSVSTLRRNKEKLVSAGAVIGNSGWKVPKSALDQVFEIGPVADTVEPPVEPPVEPLGSTERDALVAHLKEEIDFLREQVAQQSKTITEQAHAHAVIAAQLSKLELETPATEASNVHPVNPKKRWWKL